MRNAGRWLVVCLLGIAGCAPSTGGGWDPRAGESLEQEPVKLLASLDSGDFMGMLASADSNVVIMDFDANNTPIRVDGIADARAFMGQMTEAAQAQGLKFASTITRNDAWATASMGYGVVEFDQTITAGGQSMGPFKFRGTFIARREGDRWIMTHWHGSFREMPMAMAPADTTAK